MNKCSRQIWKSCKKINFEKKIKEKNFLNLHHIHKKKRTFKRKSKQIQAEKNVMQVLIFFHFRKNRFLYLKFDIKIEMKSFFLGAQLPNLFCAKDTAKTVEKLKFIVYFSTQVKLNESCKFRSVSVFLRKVHRLSLF